MSGLAHDEISTNCLDGLSLLERLQQLAVLGAGCGVIAAAEELLVDEDARHRTCACQ